MKRGEKNFQILGPRLPYFSFYRSERENKIIGKNFNIFRKHRALAVFSSRYIGRNPILKNRFKKNRFSNKLIFLKNRFKMENRFMKNNRFTNRFE